MLNPIRMTEFGLKGLLRFLWRITGWIVGTSAVLLLVAAAGWYVFGTTCGGSNIKNAGLHMGNLEQSLDMYYARTSPHEYPRSLRELLPEQLVYELSDDPWGQPYVYRRLSRTEYTLFSKGPDAHAGTEDDIVAGVVPQ